MSELVRCRVLRFLSRLIRRAAVTPVALMPWEGLIRSYGSSGRKNQRRLNQNSEVRKFGRPEDIAASAVFLTSSRLAGHLTGQRLVASGGMEGRQLYASDEVDPQEV